MERTFKKVSQKHLDEYLPSAIDQFGHIILHGDGNMYIEEPDVQKEHQRSYIAKTYAGVGNEAATYVLRFNSVKELPNDLDELEKMFLNAKAQEKINEGKISYKDSFKGLNLKAPVKEETPKQGKKEKVAQTNESGI